MLSQSPGRQTGLGEWRGTVNGDNSRSRKFAPFVRPERHYYAPQRYQCNAALTSSTVPTGSATSTSSLYGSRFALRHAELLPARSTLLVLVVESRQRGRGVHMTTMWARPRRHWRQLLRAAFRRRTFVLHHAPTAVALVQASQPTLNNPRPPSPATGAVEEQAKAPALVPCTLNAAGGFSR